MKNVILLDCNRATNKEVVGSNLGCATQFDPALCLGPGLPGVTPYTPEHKAICLILEDTHPTLLQ